MLDVYERRTKYPKGFTFASTILAAAMLGAPDEEPTLPSFLRRQKAKQDPALPPVGRWLRWQR